MIALASAHLSEAALGEEYLGPVQQVVGKNNLIGQKDRVEEDFKAGKINQQTIYDPQIDVAPIDVSLNIILSVKRQASRKLLFDVL